MCGGGGGGGRMVSLAWMNGGDTLYCDSVARTIGHIDEAERCETTDISAV